MYILKRAVRRLYELIMTVVMIGIGIYVGYNLAEWSVHTFGILTGIIIGVTMIVMCSLALWRDF